MEPMTNIPDPELFIRWRMILGEDGESGGIALEELLSSMPLEALGGYKSNMAQESVDNEGLKEGEGAGITVGDDLEAIMGEKTGGAAGEGQKSLDETITNETEAKGSTNLKPEKLREEAQERIKELDQVLNFCYERKPRRRKRKGGKEKSVLTVPAWISKVKKLFPRETKELLEADLVKRRGIEEIVESPELLDKIEPTMEMAKLLLTYKNLLSEEGKMAAKRLIRKVVDQIKDQLRTEMKPAINGALRKDKPSNHKIFRNLNLKKTLQKNLKNWDEERRKIIVDKMYFYQREQKRRPWHIVSVVDESGSMTDSVIYSAVMASIFWEIPSINSSLIIFDTQVVDLTSDVNDPVEALMKVQLGGGTNIAKALNYVREKIIVEPQKTIVVLVTDFYEGYGEGPLLTVTKNLVESEVRLIGIAALGSDAFPSYDKSMARKLAGLGMDVLACTPNQLSELIARIIRT